MSKHKFNIFDILDHINNKEYDYYSNLSELDQKAIAPLVLMRWMSGVKDQQQIMILNEFVNSMVFNIHQHPDLLWRLMCVCSPGKRTRYSWLKNQKKGNNISIQVVKKYFNYSSKEANDALALLTIDDVVNCARELGYEKDKITKIKKELK